MMSLSSGSTRSIRSSKALSILFFGGFCIFDQNDLLRLQGVPRRHHLNKRLYIQYRVVQFATLLIVIDGNGQEVGLSFRSCFEWRRIEAICGVLISHTGWGLLRVFKNTIFGENSKAAHEEAGFQIIFDRKTNYPFNFSVNHGGCNEIKYKAMRRFFTPARFKSRHAIVTLPIGEIPIISEKSSFQRKWSVHKSCLGL